MDALMERRQHAQGHARFHRVHEDQVEGQRPQRQAYPVHWRLQQRGMEADASGQGE